MNVRTFIAYITNMNMTTGAQPTSLANSIQVQGQVSQTPKLA